MLMVVLDGVQGGACKVSVFLGVEALYCVKLKFNI
jgi:hypothetical protein